MSILRAQSAQAYFQHLCLNRPCYTLARFSVSTETRLTRTKIRAFIVLAVGVDVTDGGRNNALVDIYKIKYDDFIFYKNLHFNHLVHELAHASSCTVLQWCMSTNLFKGFPEAFSHNCTHAYGCFRNEKKA